ncbi:Leukocyte receptor cluster member 1 [Portunus trituberculatus]|uniref:Leukocyte receptor cluster member 1 n=1 Tax=Portunus trituberculatus TaxID=210409 RepID=A0A5B7FG81_PORTR|nr:Leukocyte receptor cluster member 1 [Portunus trituberculatus]
MMTTNKGHEEKSESDWIPNFSVTGNACDDTLEMRWHVRTKENIARVRRDEAQAAEEEKQRVLRAKLAEQEARTALLRTRARQKYDGDEGLDAAEPKATSTGQATNTTKTHVADIYTAEGNINFFKDLEEGKQTHGKNEEYEKEKKEEQEKYEKKIGYLTYLGQDSHEAQGKKAWYEEAESRITYRGDEEEEGETKEVGLKSKDKLDPIHDIIKYGGIKLIKKVPGMPKPKAADDVQIVQKQNVESKKKVQQDESTADKRKYRHKESKNKKKRKSKKRKRNDDNDKRDKHKQRDCKRRRDDSSDEDNTSRKRRKSNSHKSKSKERERKRRRHHSSTTTTSSTSAYESSEDEEAIQEKKRKLDILRSLNCLRSMWCTVYTSSSKFHYEAEEGESVAYSQHIEGTLHLRHDSRLVNVVPVDRILRVDHEVKVSLHQLPGGIKATLLPLSLKVGCPTHA